MVRAGLSLLSLLGLAACGEAGGPVPLQRLWTGHGSAKEAGSGTPESPGGLGPWEWQEAGGTFEPGWRVPSGEEVGLSFPVPPERPCWLLLDFADPEGGPVTVEVRHQKQLLRSSREVPSTLPGASPFREVRLDLGAFQGRFLELSIRPGTDGPAALLTRPRLVAQEAFDLRRLEVVVVLVPAEGLPERVQALAQVLGPGQGGELGDSGTSQTPQQRRQVLLSGLGAGHDPRDRELFVWSGEPPLAPADSWIQQDPWVGEADPGRSGPERLLAIAGRSRPHPVTLVVETRAGTPVLVRELAHLRRRLGARDARTLWLVASLDGAGSQPWWFRPPQDPGQPSFAAATDGHGPVDWDGLAEGLLWAMDRWDGRGPGPAPGNSPLIAGS